MSFKSKAQMRAAFGGHLGSTMKKKAKAWADETPNPKRLPEKVKSSAIKGLKHASRGSR
jgi:hypothetical protein